MTLQTLHLQGTLITRTSLQVQLGGIPNTVDAGPNRIRTLLLVSRLFPGSSWIGTSQTRNTISGDTARKRGSSELLPNSDSRVLVYAVACCFCHVGSGSLPCRPDPCRRPLTLLRASTSATISGAGRQQIKLQEHGFMLSSVELPC